MPLPMSLLFPPIGLIAVRTAALVRTMNLKKDQVSGDYGGTMEEGRANRGQSS
jgi:hypothetical protein